MHVIKTVFLGDTAVGKTSIIFRYIFNRFHDQTSSTIGASFFSYRINIDNQEVKVNIWDTAGQERYRAFVPMYYRDAEVCVIVFDITNIDIKNIEYWIEEIKEQNNRENVKIFLVGNKSDLVGENKDLSILDPVIEKYNLEVIKTSALEGDNIDELFEIINESLEIPEKSHTGLLNIRDVYSENTWSSCFGAVVDQLGYLKDKIW